MNSVKLQWIRLIGQKYVALIHINEDLSKGCIKIIPFSIASKRMVTIKKDTK